MLWLILRRQLNDAKVLEEYNKSDNNNKNVSVGNYMEDIPLSMNMYGWEVENNWRSFRKDFLVDRCCVISKVKPLRIQL